MAELYRYAAFISYSSKDAAFARRLHRALESYGIPSSLGKFDLIGGGKKNRIYPVFRDREELSAGHLGDQIEANLKASAALIVVCSPNGAASPWVQKEIEFFAAQGRHAKIFAIIPDTAPLVDEHGADATQSCFPPPFRGDVLAGDKLEPLAADARKGKDGFRNAWLKVVAGMIKVSPGQIIDRDRKRRRTQAFQLSMTAAASVLGLSLLFGFLNALSWRAPLSSYAESLRAKGRPFEAVTFALAGVGGPETLMPARSSDADTVLQRTGYMQAVRDLGRPWAAALSNDGRSAVTVAEGGVFSYDLVRGTVARISSAENVSLVITATGRGLLEQVLLSDGGATTYVDLQHPTQRQSLHVGPTSSAWTSASSSGAAVTVLDGNTLFYVDVARGAVHRFDGVSSSELASNGDLIFLRTSGEAMLAQLVAPEPRALGRADSVQIAPDGQAALLVNGSSGLYIDFVDSARRTIAAEGGFRLLRRGAVLAFGPPRPSIGPFAAPAILYDLARNSSYALGEVSDVFVANAANWFIAQRVNGEIFVGDLQSFRLHSLGQGMPRDILNSQSSPSIAISPNGQRAVIRAPDGYGYEVDLRAPALSRRRLGSLGRPDIGGLIFSGDGALFASRTKDGSAYLYDLGRRGAAQDLGRVREGEVILTENSGALLVHYLEQTAVVYSMADAPPTATGRSLAEEVCRRSGNVLRPFPGRMRAPQLSASRGHGNTQVFASLRGRPWHPCDWRGLSSAEGWRQLWRQVTVLYLGARDYTCEERTAAGAEDATSRERCRRMRDADVEGTWNQ